MKNFFKLFLPLVLVATLSTAASPDVHTPASQGLYRQEPYLSDWSSRLLTNSSGSGAVAYFFSDTNSAVALWNEVAPFAQFQNTNALTSGQSIALNYVLVSGLTNGLISLADMPDAIKGFTGNDGFLNGLPGSLVLSTNLIVGLSYGAYNGHGELMITVNNFVVGQTYQFTPGTYFYSGFTGNDQLGISFDNTGITPPDGVIVSTGGKFVATQTSYQLSAPRNGFYSAGLQPVTAQISQVTGYRPLDLQMPNVTWQSAPANTSASVWTVQSGDVGNIPQDAFVPLQQTVTFSFPNFITNSSPNQIAAFEPNSFFDAIALWTPAGYSSNGVNYVYASQTNNWYVDKYGNEKLLGSESVGGVVSATAFVGDGSKLSGVSPLNINFSAVTNPPTLVALTNGFGISLAGIATNTATSNQTKVLVSVALDTTISFGFLTNATPTSLFTNVNRRGIARFSFTATNAYSVTLTNWTRGLFITEAATASSTNVSRKQMEIDVNPNDVIQLFAPANVTPTASYIDQL